MGTHKIILALILTLQSATAFAFHSTLTCKEHTDITHVLTLRVKNKYLKRIDRNTPADEAPVLYFDRYNEDKSYMVYSSDSKSGFEIALPTHEWEPNEYKLDVEMTIGERAIVDHRVVKKTTKYKCITAPTTTTF